MLGGFNVPARSCVPLPTLCSLFDAERRGRHSQTPFGNEKKNGNDRDCIIDADL